MNHKLRLFLDAARMTTQISNNFLKISKIFIIFNKNNLVTSSYTPSVFYLLCAISNRHFLNFHTTFLMGLASFQMKSYLKNSAVRLKIFAFWKRSFLIKKGRGTHISPTKLSLVTRTIISPDAQYVLKYVCISN